MRLERNARIVATLGPATSSSEMIRRLFLAGVDGFRFNFSYGVHKDHAQNYKAVREPEFYRPIGVLLDLKGAKLRIGKFTDPEHPVVIAGGMPFGHSGTTNLCG